MFGVGQPNEWQIILCPITAVSIGAVGADCKDFRVTRGEGRVVVAQAREMGAAVWSHEAAQEDQNDIFLAAKVRKPDGTALVIREFKIGGGKGSHQLSVSSYQLVAQDIILHYSRMGGAR